MIRHHRITSVLTSLQGVPVQEIAVLPPSVEDRGGRVAIGSVRKTKGVRTKTAHFHFWNPPEIIRSNVTTSSRRELAHPEEPAEIKECQLANCRLEALLKSIPLKTNRPR